MPAIKCSSCGKFRKENDCVLQEEITSDGFQIDQYFECKYCVSDADYERYFKNKETENGKYVIIAKRETEHLKEISQLKEELKRERLFS